MVPVVGRQQHMQRSVVLSTVVKATVAFVESEAVHSVDPVQLQHLKLNLDSGNEIVAIMKEKKNSKKLVLCQTNVMN